MAYEKQGEHVTEQYWVIVSTNPDGTHHACGPIDAYDDAVEYASQYPAEVRWEVVELFCPA
jgi:hypothetical protein